MRTKCWKSRTLLTTVICRPNLIALGVRQLQLDYIRRKALFVQERTRHAAKTVTRLLVALIP